MSMPLRAQSFRHQAFQNQTFRQMKGAIASLTGVAVAGQVLWAGVALSAIASSAPASFLQPCAAPQKPTAAANTLQAGNKEFVPTCSGDQCAPSSETADAGTRVSR